MYGTGLITHTTLASGVTRFAWHAPRDHGDGLLVDMDIASTRWCDVADVLLWPTPVDAATAVASAAHSHAILAVVAQRPADWLVLTFSHNVNPALTPRTVTHHMVARAGDSSTLLAAIVDRYRAVVSERDPRCWP